MKINRESLLRAWKSKNQILEGIVNKVFKNEHIEEIAEERMMICESNLCGYYDADGSSERAVVKGQPACAGCGCALALKVRCMSCHCHLKDEKLHPLWDAVISPAEETLLRERLTAQNESQTDQAVQG